MYGHKHARVTQSGLRQDDGVTSLEYAIIAGLIAVVIATSVGSLGLAVNGSYQLVEAFFASL